MSLRKYPSMRWKPDEPLLATSIKTCLGGPGARAWAIMESNPLAWEEMKTGWAEHTKRRARYKFTAAASNKPAEILLYGPIGSDFFGDGITGTSFQRELRKIGAADNITVRIDSPGGAVNDARTIYSLLIDTKARIDIVVDGFAASAASLVAMAGDTISIAEGGFVMIHEARATARGTAADMARASQILQALTETIADTYVARTGNSMKKIQEWMRVETWFNGKDAVASGFADTLIENKSAPTKASAYADAFERFPKKLLPGPTQARSLLRKIERLANARAN